MDDDTNEPDFTLFHELQEEIKVCILTFVADAPLERPSFNGNGQSPDSTLTHRLPYVSKEFKRLASLDCFWKAATRRRAGVEPLWRFALYTITDTKENDWIQKSITALIECAHDHIAGGYKELYKCVVSTYLRFTSPVFHMPCPLE